MLAVKSVLQNYSPPEEVQELLESFRRMVNHCIQIGLASNVSSLKKLSLLSYSQLKHYKCLSYYKLCAISRAAGILAARRKSLKRGYESSNPYAVKPHLVSCYGFKIESGILRIPRGRRTYWNVPLNDILSPSYRKLVLWSAPSPLPVARLASASPEKFPRKPAMVWWESTETFAT